MWQYVGSEEEEGRDEGPPRKALQEEVGRRGPAQGSFVTPLLRKPSAGPWNVVVCLKRRKEACFHINIK